jgi:hypothetical protein
MHWLACTLKKVIALRLLLICRSKLLLQGVSLKLRFYSAVE